MELASQDQIVPASLPDTQNADALTQSQEALSQQPTLNIWGRLCPVMQSKVSNLRTVELTRDSGYTLGRSENCDIRLTTNEMRETWLKVVSKVHFRIYRERINNTNEIVVYLEDLSYNGTYVDRRLVGCRNRIIIENNSIISIAREDLSVYVFMSTIVHELPCQLPPELKQRYAIGHKLGTGACGEVRLVFKKDGSEKFAMKIIKKNYFSIGNGNIFNNPENIRNEVEILKKLKHSCIIHLEDIHDTPEAMYIILELMEGGELFDRIRSRGKLSEPYTKLIFYQVTLAVHYLHRQGITHRDLKPENILLKDYSDSPLVKVSDFGMSKFVDAQTMMKTYCGTPMYVAPEIVTTYGRNSYTNQVDVWSLGVILYVCLSGIFPFQINDVTLEEQIKSGRYEFYPSRFQYVSSDAIRLIKRMMTVNPKERITVPHILLHSWLRDARMREEVNKLLRNSNVENDENIENVPPPIICPKRPRLMV
ncbi:hypothetical protein P5V15_007741 [Pogonomyrmex californicus]